MRVVLRFSLLTSQIRIRVGEYDFSSVQERLPYVERGIAKKVVHPKYNFFTYEYDLALVRLESSLTFAAHISPICLPATDDLLIGENATVTGWGRLSEGGTLPSVLQEVIRQTAFAESAHPQLNVRNSRESRHPAWTHRIHFRFDPIRSDLIQFAESRSRSRSALSDPPRDYTISI